MIRAYFIAPTYQQAVYSAHRMGFPPREWKLLSRIEDVQGLRHTTLPVYRVGSYHLPRHAQEALAYLERVGVPVERVTV